MKSYKNIDLGQGQPDFTPPPKTFLGLDRTKVSRYGAVQGNSTLREKIASKLIKKKTLDSDNVLITNGASEALNLAVRLLTPGSEILITCPYYYYYWHLIQKSFMRAKLIKLNDYRLNISDFNEKIEGCKAVILNNPSNPTGVVESGSTVREVARICSERNVLLVYDEVYSDFIYRGRRTKLFGDNIISINSFSKTFSLCGERVGYAYSKNPGIIDKLTVLKQYTSRGTSTLAQKAALNALDSSKHYFTKILHIYKKRRDLICKGLRSLDLEFPYPEGAFYVFPRVGDGTKTQKVLKNRYGLDVIDGKIFGFPENIRISYTREESALAEAIDRLSAFINSK